MFDSSKVLFLHMPAGHSFDSPTCAFPYVFPLGTLPCRQSICSATSHDLGMFFVEDAPFLHLIVLRCNIKASVCRIVCHLKKDRFNTHHCTVFLQPKLLTTMTTTRTRTARTRTKTKTRTTRTRTRTTTTLKAKHQTRHGCFFSQLFFPVCLEDGGIST